MRCTLLTLALIALFGALAPGAAAAPPPVHWIEIALRDDAGEPVPGELDVGGPVVEVHRAARVAGQQGLLSRYYRKH